MSLFDQKRRKRNCPVYETVGLVSRREVEQALTFAPNLCAPEPGRHHPRPHRGADRVVGVPPEAVADHGCYEHLSVS